MLRVTRTSISRTDRSIRAPRRSLAEAVGASPPVDPTWEAWREELVARSDIF